jgi:L-histidine Nalpha-methyltransferase / hercynylcysteine S-oxide synthase
VFLSPLSRWIQTDRNSHLVNDGVEETPPSRDVVSNTSKAASGLSPYDLFIKLEGVNVGFQHWHPVSVVEKGDRLCGQADLGGVWEWTSSVLEKHEGFQPMALYPLYTGKNSPTRYHSYYSHWEEDFFDGKHNITLGGSWATHPRIAGRKSL